MLRTLMGDTEDRAGVAHGEPELFMKASRYAPYRILGLTSSIIRA